MRPKRHMLNLIKMQAAGNDFLVVNDMRKTIGGGTSVARLAARLCHRRLGVGADGLILLQPSRNGSAAYRMRIINSDGSEAEMCGNGSRCAVKFAVESGIAPATHTFETLAGRISGKYISPARIRVALTDPSDFRPEVTVAIRNRRVRGAFINTGVPHFVVFVPRIDTVDVKTDGAELRRHRVFAPRGTNVNFVQIVSAARSKIRVRTYERGVESETLACGTGATASAVVSALTRNIRPPVAVATSGGAVLAVNFHVAAGVFGAGRISASASGVGRAPSAGVFGVTMEGPVEKVFETRVNS